MDWKENQKVNHEKRMNDVRDFIRRHWEDHHYAPSIKEIGMALGGISNSAVSYYIDKLVKDGWLEKRVKGTGRGGGSSRNIVPAEIFAGRDVFPKYVLYDGGKFTPVAEILPNGDYALLAQDKEVRIEKMTDGRIAILAVDKEKP